MRKNVKAFGKAIPIGLLIVLLCVSAPMVEQAKAEDVTTIGVHVGDKFHYRVSYSAQGAPGVWPYISGKADLLATLKVVDITGTTITCDITANYLNGKVIHSTGYEYMSPTSPVEILLNWGVPITIFPANIKAGQWQEMFYREPPEEHPVVTFTVTTSKLHGSIVDIIDMSVGTQSVYWEWYQNTGVPICMKTVTSTFTCTIALIGRANK